MNTSELKAERIRQVLCRYWKYGEQLDAWQTKECEILGQSDTALDTPDSLDKDGDISPQLGI